MAARKKEVWIELQRTTPTGDAVGGRYPIMVRISAINAFYARGTHTVVYFGQEDPAIFYGLQSEFREAIS